jgi:hypothetical protein
VGVRGFCLLAAGSPRPHKNPRVKKPARTGRGAVADAPIYDGFNPLMGSEPQTLSFQSHRSLAERPNMKSSSSLSDIAPSPVQCWSSRRRQIIDSKKVAAIRKLFSDTVLKLRPGCPRKRLLSLSNPTLSSTPTATGFSIAMSLGV